LANTGVASMISNADIAVSLMLFFTYFLLSVDKMAKSFSKFSATKFQPNAENCGVV
jgi:hypothetical protein